MENKKNFDVKPIFTSNIFRVFFMAAVLFIVSGILQPSYFSLSHFLDILFLSGFLGVICIGQTMLIITGGIDLSVAYTITFSACVFAQTTKQYGNGIIGLIAALGVAILIGLFKGFGVAYLKITPMVMTLATNAILMSCTFLYTQGVLKGTSTKFVTALVKNDLFGIKYSILLWIALGLLATFILQKTTFGRKIYAIGSNIRVAQLSGVSTRLVLLGVYVFSTIMMVIAGILLIGYLGYPNYTMGDGYQLISIAAVVIGGTSILGGQGSYLGTIGGVITIYLIQSILTILNIAEAGKEIVYGAIILIILLAYGRKKKNN